MLRLPTPPRRLQQEVTWLLVAAPWAFLVGIWQLVHVNYSRLLAVLPVVIALTSRPQLCLVLGIAALPFFVGPSGGGFSFTLSDALFALATAGAVTPLLLDRSLRTRVPDVGPLLLVAAPFLAWLSAVAVVHLSVPVLANTVQYVQLTLLPLLLGALVLERRAASTGLRALMLTASVLAGIWATVGNGFFLSGNKNPAGQILSGAVLVLLVRAPSWRWRLLLPLLVVGLFFTQSRGALVGTAAGLLVVIVLGGFGNWRRTLAVVVPLVVVVAVGYQSLPAEVRERNTDLRISSGARPEDLTAAEYSAWLRVTFREQGLQLIEENPVFGVGPGNYLTGVPGTESYTNDPHNMAIRTAGDIGLPGLGAFCLLLIGSSLLVLRRRRRNPYVVLALGVQASTIVHGLVDVYWVRATPVLGWFLIGMALNRRLDQRRDGSRRHGRRLAIGAPGDVQPAVPPPTWS